MILTCALVLCKVPGNACFHIHPESCLRLVLPTDIASYSRNYAAGVKDVYGVSRIAKVHWHPIYRA